MIIDAKEGGGIKLEPVGNEVVTLPRTWPIGDELIIEAQDRPVTVVLNPHQTIKLRIGNAS